MSVIEAKDNYNLRAAMIHVIGKNKIILKRRYENRKINLVFRLNIFDNTGINLDKYTF